MAALDIPGGYLITQDGEAPAEGVAQIQVWQPEVTWARRNVPPFAPLYVPVDHWARVEITCPVAGATVTIMGMFQSPGGEFWHLARDYIFTAPGQKKVDLVPLRESWVFSVSVISQGIPLHQAAQVRVGLQRSGHPDEMPHYWWIEDFVNDFFSPDWPGPRKFGLKEVLGITDYQVVNVTTGDTESFPVLFNSTTRRVDVLALAADALIRFYTVLEEARTQVRVRAGERFRVDGAFAAFTHQSATVGAPATLHVVAWW
jgi:hypothetical protein